MLEIKSRHLTSGGPIFTPFLYFQNTDRPLCRSGTKKIGTVIGNNITVVCNVDAYPKEKNYQWWFHEHGHKSEKKMLSQVHTETFTHRVKNHNGFGTIYCQARNEVGWQNKPCMFDIHPGGMLFEQLVLIY